MTPFPRESLQPVEAVISGVPGDAAVTIPLRPITLAGEVVETTIHLEGVALPSLDPRDLAGRSLEFPVNPAEGYIDGSVYIGHAHHPVDVTRITFSIAGDGGLVAKFSAKLVFTHEGLMDFEDVAVDFEAGVRLQAG